MNPIYPAGKLNGMLYQTRSFSFGGGAVTPAVKFLLIANTAVFVLQLVLPDEVINGGLDWCLHWCGRIFICGSFSPINFFTAG